MLAGLVLCGGLASVATNHIPRLRAGARWLRLFCAAMAAPVGALGGLSLCGGVIDLATPGKDVAVAVIMVAMGAAMLAPFAMLLYKQRRSLNPSTTPTAAPSPATLAPAAPAFVPKPAPAAFASSSGFDDDGDDDDSPFAAEYQFNYQSPAVDVDERVAFISHVSQASGQLYFEGRRADTNEARSYRVDRVVGSMIDTDSGTPYDAGLLAGLLGLPVARDTAQFTPAKGQRAGWRTGVCFLGFGYAKESELTELAEDADWMVFGEVGRHVDYVVLNGRAGARQRQRAEDAGATVIDENAFRGLV